MAGAITVSANHSYFDRVREFSRPLALPKRIVAILQIKCWNAFPSVLQGSMHSYPDNRHDFIDDRWDEKKEREVTSPVQTV